MSTPQLVQTNIGAIREKLRLLWAAAASSDEGLIRARTHNLIVYTADDVSTEETTRRLIECTGERPGRVIIIDTEPGQPRGLNAWVTTFSRQSGKHKIWGELIALNIGEDIRADVHSTVISLLAPDLPVYLWWEGVPDPDDPLLRYMLPSADRVLVDLELSPDPKLGFARLLQLSPFVRLSDLTWARLTPWRNMLAQIWETPDFQEALPHIRTLDIYYAADAEVDTVARACLLAAWLVQKMGWQITGVRANGNGSYTIAWRKRKWDGKIELSARHQVSAPGGEILRIFVQAGEDPPFVMPTLELQPERGCVDIRFNDGSAGSPHGSYPYRSVTTSAALVEELDMGYDPSYSLALGAAGLILKSAQKR